MADTSRAKRIKADYPAGWREAPPFARWQRCSSPSPAALDLAEAVGGTVVEMGRHEHDALREAVIIELAWWPGLLVLRVIDAAPDTGCYHDPCDPAWHGDTTSAGAASIARRAVTRYDTFLHAAVPTVGLTMPTARFVVSACNGAAMFWACSR